MECLKLLYVSDNGLQYSATLFKDFANLYGFTDTTNSPLFPQANGGVERAVHTIKSDDPYLAIDTSLRIHSIGNWILPSRTFNTSKVTNNNSYYPPSNETTVI